VIRRSRHSDQRAVGINAAVVQAGSNDATTNSAGDFVLRLPFVPDEKDDTIVVFRHDDYMPAFRRLADLPTDGETLVEMEPKWRITVTDFNGTLPGETFQSHRAILGRSIKERLALVSEVVITADEHREAIIKKLYDYQQRRALYAKETLAEVGNMSGATIGLFGFVERLAPDAIKISCDLTDLETAEVKKSAGIVIKDLDRLDLHAERLADHLLFRLCEVHLLYPRDKALCGTVINAKGYPRFRPRGWAAWNSTRSR